MPKIEMGKQYKTRSGLPVRVLATDRKDRKYPVVALMTRNNTEYTELFREDGGWSWDSQEVHKYDLIEVKPRIKREYWVNVYRTFSSYPYNSKDTADAYALGDRIACVPIIIDCEEGEGLV